MELPCLMDNPIRGLWVGDRLSLMEQLSIRSFLANGHTYELYVYNDVANVPAGTTLCDANTIIPESGVFRLEKGPHKGSVASFSNIFRYKLIYEKGGFWCDTDVVCLQPFDFGEDYVIAGVNQPEGLDLNIGHFKAPAGAAFLKQCYDYGMGLERSEIKWTQTGNTIARKAVKEHGLWERIVDPQVFSPLDWWDAAKLIEPGFELDLNGTYAIHLWNECWRVGKVGSDSLWQRMRNRFSPLKERRFGTDTLLGRLQAKYLDGEGA